MRKKGAEVLSRALGFLGPGSADDGESLMVLNKSASAWTGGPRKEWSKLLWNQNLGRFTP